MKRKTVSSIPFGSIVKLTPRGKDYLVLAIDRAEGNETVGGRYKHCVILQDTANGKDKRLTWGTTVYLKSNPIV